MQPLKL